MLCKKPFLFGSLPCACSRCMPCRINRRRIWANRMVLESYKHVGSSFVTLTYDETTLPTDRSLNPTHPKNWLKRLRKKVSPSLIRFFLVGEYGDQTQRPHYHAAIFGLDRLSAGGLDGRSGVVSQTWGLGHTYVGDLTPQSAGYVAGYVTKKMTMKEDPRLHGRYPEFARMSLRPGLGALAVPDLAKVLESDSGLDSIAVNGDVPTSFRQSGKLLPLGRYLRGKLRSSLGLSKQLIKESVCRRSLQELQRLRQEDVALAEAQAVNPTRFILERHTQKINNLTTKVEIYQNKSRRTL